MHYLREHMPEASEEVDELVKGYFASTQAGEGMDPLNFKWDIYTDLDAHGRILFIAARDEDHKLRGFVDYFMLPHMHHNQVVATCDMLAVHPDFRSMGIGTQLIQHAEQWLKAQGVSHIVHHFRNLYKEQPLFSKLGYEAKEVCFVKDIR